MLSDISRKINKSQVMIINTGFLNNQCLTHIYPNFTNKSITGKQLRSFFGWSNENLIDIVNVDRRRIIR